MKCHVTGFRLQPAGKCAKIKFDDATRRLFQMSVTLFHLLSAFKASISSSEASGASKKGKCVCK